MSRFALWRTVLFLIPLISVFTVAFGTLSLAAGLIDRSGRGAHACARAWSRLILLVSGTRVDVQGALPPAGAYVYAANHQSIYDIPILFWSIPRQLRIIAKASLGKIPFLGWHLRLAGHLLVDRDKPGAGILKRMRGLVAEHASLIVFPEGTRSADGAVGRFKGGVFLLAIEHGLPIVPVSVRGSRHVMRRGEVTVRPGRVIVTIHDPVATTGLGRDDARGLGERVKQIVESAAE
ncbi:MAG TPA: lysophospholipid acyltransferase family protein [Vicinamibacterales bacterium]|nr:lysophospholipid acyltransferase family protein [Vicinamibacterales bacterium]